MYRASSISLAVLGALFCVMNALGIDTFCTTSGCAITADFTVFGLSLYWFGALGFLLFIGLRLTMGPRLAFYFAATFLLLDVLFLLLMSFMAPCLSCVIVGILIAATAMSAYFDHRTAHMEPHAPRTFFAICLVWIVALSPNLVNISLEMIPPYAIHGNADAQVKIFFSPTCPACRTMVEQMIESGGNDVALYPVGKGNQDMRMLCAMKCNYESTGDIKTALEACWSANCKSDPRPIDRLKLHFHVWRNKNYLVRMGKDSVPVMISEVVPNVASQPAVTQWRYGTMRQRQPGEPGGSAAVCSFMTQSDCDG